MCGILGAIVVNRDVATEDMKAIYENQQTRGKQGAGIAVWGKEVDRFRAEKPEEVFDSTLALSIQTGDYVMFHHRYPTSTANLAEFNHPISNESNDIFIIHNGVVSNDDELFEQLKEKGHKFETFQYDPVKKANCFTDSEVIVHQYEECLKSSEGDMVKSVQCLLDSVKGSYTLAIMFPKQEETSKAIYLLRKDNPLFIFENGGNYYFASQLPEKGFKLISKAENGEFGKLDKSGYTKIHKFDVPEPISYGSFYSCAWDWGKSDKSWKGGKNVCDDINCDRCGKEYSVMTKDLEVGSLAATYCKKCRKIVKKDPKFKRQKQTGLIDWTNLGDIGLTELPETEFQVGDVVIVTDTGEKGYVMDYETQTMNDKSDVWYMVFLELAGKEKWLLGEELQMFDDNVEEFGGLDGM